MIVGNASSPNFSKVKELRKLRTCHSGLMSHADGLSALNSSGPVASANEERAYICTCGLSSFFMHITHDPCNYVHLPSHDLKIFHPPGSSKALKLKSD